MDGCNTYRNCALAVLGGIALFAAPGPVRAHAEQDSPVDVRRAAVALQQYAQDVISELSGDLAALSLTMIGGHVFPTPPPPPVVTGTPPPPPTTTGGPTPPPPPPPTVGGPTPTPPPPTIQGGPGPSGAPEPATIVTGLVGLGIASAAGWYRYRRQR